MNDDVSMEQKYHKKLVQVALPVPLYKVFDYLCKVDMSLPVRGGRVLVPFGNRKLIGVVMGHTETTDIDKHKLKSIQEVLDNTPLLDEFSLKFAKWLASYYHYPLGETLAVMLPTLLKHGKTVSETITTWAISDAANDENFVKAQIKKTAKTQWRDFGLIKDNPHSGEAMLKIFGVSGKNLKILAEKGLIQARVCTPSKPKPPTLKTAHLPLNDEQVTALAVIDKAVNDGRYQGILLNGVTGAGKTEVYLQAMAKVLAQGKQVLVIVPEIGLTPQSKERFAKRFAANVVVLHSGLNDTERLAGWQACRSGQAQIVIGTRSCVFYPFDVLGLIVIDEAHDTSFKQQDHLRYQAVDVSLYLGFCQNIPVVLGTATPSLEQFKLVMDGKLTECRLTKRAGNAKPPVLELVDMRQGAVWSSDKQGVDKSTHLAHRTLMLIKQTLAQGEQVLVFLNRRGYAPVLLCRACGWQADCIQCSSHLTVHKLASGRRSWLSCHHCGYQTNVPTACPECRSSNIDTLGQGTGQLFAHLHSLFNNPQKSATSYPVMQIDRDTVRSKGAWDKLYRQINEGTPMILVGTQMLAKGHHFDKVSLVVIADADAGLWSADFRAAEQTAQTILQVAGRAGRGDVHGRVLIQTMKPDNSTLLKLISQEYSVFASELLNERRRLGLPPFSHAVLVRAEAESLDNAQIAIIRAKELLPTTHPFAVLAPINAPMLKKSNRYHVQMLILSKTRKPLHDMLNVWWEQVLGLPSSRQVRLALDIDPVGW
ncbi:MAG: primosomal protein N' [Moraxella sp.]|nr:primosomal protein N' [Moraxella sp.]